MSKWQVEMWKTDCPPHGQSELYVLGPGFVTAGNALAFAKDCVRESMGLASMYYHANTINDFLADHEDANIIRVTEGNNLNADREVLFQSAIG